MDAVPDVVTSLSTLGPECARWCGSGTQYTTTAVDHWLGKIQGQRPSSGKDHPKHVPPGVTQPYLSHPQA